MTDAQFNEALEKAKTLPGGEILSHYVEEELRDICNGVGAAWMDCVSVYGNSASDLLNLLLPWAIPASLIHDVRYRQGGGGFSRGYADFEFYENLKICIGRKFWTPSFWRKRFLAKKMYNALRLFGGLAFSGQD